MTELRTVPVGGEARGKALPLPAAIEHFVRPGMHLNFASTPSRSNAAIREIARQFRGKNPEFVFSATGFHSMAHLLARLGLGRRYIGCFFGDNYPTPRPNRLYRELARRPGLLEHWSLWTYVSALRAGAFGHEYAVIHSLSGTSLGADLARAGKLLEIPAPEGDARPVTLVRALVPDIVFLHAPAADVLGNVLLAPPLSEGVYGALGARLGVVATVDRLLSTAEVARFPELRPLPAHRVLSVSEEAFGAHPQPLHFAPSAPSVPSYRDDYAQYEFWRAIGEGLTELSEFSTAVLDAEDGASGYLRFVGRERLEALRTRPGRALARPSPTVSVSSPEPALTWQSSSAQDRLLVLAARAIVRRVAALQPKSILAGLGQAWNAVRLAELLLRREHPGLDCPEIMVETGFAGVGGEAPEAFLLSQANVASAARLASVDVMLGALTCGNQQCLGVIGAAQVDPDGNLNSSWVDGQFLVGSGGASDIAACAEDVIVLTQCDRNRLVSKVEYVTSSGRRVRTVVTGDCVFERELGAEWQVSQVPPTAEGELSEAALAERCPWPLHWPEHAEPVGALSPTEARFLSDLRRNSARRGQEEKHA